jgi:hypothetical protein
MAQLDTNAPLDTSVVPRALRARAAAADQALKNMREGRAPDQPAEPPAQAAEQPQDGEQRQDAPAPPAQQPTPPAANSEAPRQEQPPASADVWEQRYHSLNGQFAPLREELRNLRQENDQLREAVSNLEQARPNDSAPPAEVKPFDVSAVLTDAEREEWGEDFVSILDRVTKAATAPLEAENKRLKSKIENREQHEQVRTREQMHALLDKEVPTWETINNEPEFARDWLGVVDQASGLTRKKLLQNAYARNEATRVAWFFKQYLSEKDGASPEAQRDPGQGRAAAPKSLDQFAAPGKGRTANGQPAAAAGDARPFKLSEYTKFLSDKTHGRLRLTTAEIQQREAAMEQAIRDGTMDMSA